MPPRLALIGCYGFIAWAFWRHAKANPYPSAALWLPTLWMMRCGSRGIDYWLGGGEDGRLDPVLLAIMIAIGAVILIRRRCDWGQVFVHNWAIFLFYAYLTLSLTWVDDLSNPIIKLFRPVGDLIMALIIATEFDPAKAIGVMFRRTAIALIPLSIVLIKYFPDLGKMQDKHWGADMWIGVTTHKNPLGQLCVAAALGFFWYLAQCIQSKRPIKKQILAWVFVAQIAYLFNAGGNDDSRSSTSILCLGIAVSLYFLIGRAKKNTDALVTRIVTGSALVGIFALILRFFGSSLQAFVAGLFGKSPTLTDRTFLWADVIRIGMQHPLFGTGYGAFWGPWIYPQLSKMVDNHPAEAHNGYLETFANLGLIGVALLALIIITSIRSATRTAKTDFEYGRIRLALLFMVVVMNYSEATFPRGTHLWWFGFLVFAVYARPWVYWPQNTPQETFAGLAEEPAEPVALEQVN